MSHPRIDPATFLFLKKLHRNNNREWFQKNKAIYQEAHSNVLAFVEALLAEMNKHDQISTENARRAMYRIYADTRFHPNQQPNTERFAAHFGREKPQLRGGYN